MPQTDITCLSEIENLPLKMETIAERTDRAVDDYLSSNHSLYAFDENEPIQLNPKRKGIKCGPSDDMPKTTIRENSPVAMVPTTPSTAIEGNWPF